jgi:hypothetical protein
MRRGDAIKTLGTLLVGGSAVPSLITPRASRQTGAGGVADVRAFGAKGDGTTDDHPAIQRTLEALSASGGGVVWFPPGHYRIGASIAVRPVLSQTIVLRGGGMRSTYLYPAVNGMTAVQFGSATPDNSGRDNNKTQYCGMEDLSVSGSLLSAGDSVGVELVEMQKGWMQNVIIEGFNKGASVGLHLRGSRTSGGVGAPAAPHTWRCMFTNVVVASTMRPLLIENGDENDFVSCNFGLQPGINAPPDSLAAVEIKQGHNNRFFGLLVSGDRDPHYRPAYVGLRLSTPTNGDNLGHQVYGLVAEGFNHGVWIDEGVRDVWIKAFDSSISNHAFWNGSDDGEVGRERQNNVNIELVGGPTTYRTRRSDWGETITFRDGDTRPSVKGSDTYTCSNSKPTTIKEFSEGRPGQLIFIRLDQNTRIAAGQTIRPMSNADISGAPHLLVSFALIGGVWEQISQSRNA